MRINGDPHLADVALEILRKAPEPLPFHEILERSRTRRTGVRYASLRAALQKLAKSGQVRSVSHRSGNSRVLWEAV